MNLQQWLQRLESLHPTEIELGLSRVSSVADRLGIDASSATVITVAGTNGKGSCVQALSTLLDASGHTFGAFTSPHLDKYNERIVVNGKLAEDDLIVEAFEAIECARDDISLTYFEFNTLAALWIFQKLGVSFWLLEVGLGGRLDAVNIIDANLAVITSIGLDHQDWLGESLDDIGREKAGICRLSSPVIYCDDRPLESLVASLPGLASKVMLYGKDFGVCDNGQLYFQSSLTQIKNVFRASQLNVSVNSVLGALQALSMLDALPAPDLVPQILSSIRLAGRYQKISDKTRVFILDVAHNQQACQRLAVRLQQEPQKVRVAVVAMMADKALHEALLPLVGVVDDWYLADLEGNPRAAPNTVMLQVLLDLGVAESRISLFGSVKSAMSAVPDMTSSVVFGSFFTIAAATHFLS